MKVACIYHKRDLDGWTSGAIVKTAFFANNKESVIDQSSLFQTPLNKELEINNLVTRCYPADLKNNIIDENNYIDLIAYDYGMDVPNLDSYDQIILVDVSFKKEIMTKLFLKHKENFIWIDHHKSAINENNDKIEGLRNSSYAACELTWMYYFKNDKMPKIVEYLGLYDSFRHKGTKHENDVLMFQFASRGKISNVKEAEFYLLGWNETLEATFLKDGRKIYSYLKVMAKEKYQKAYSVTIPDFEKYKVLAVNEERFNPINYGIEYDADIIASYWNKGGIWECSLYNDNDNADCSEIASLFGGGGHKGAAGFTFKEIPNWLK